MMTNLFQRSLKTRITLITLIIFVVSNGVMAFYACRVLQDEMGRKLGREQFSTVSLLATQVDDELRDRISVLENNARQITPALLRNAAALQQWLDQRAAFEILFNGGGYVTGADGMATASTPISVGRVGLGFLEQSHVAAALKDGKTTIGKPRNGKPLKTPVIGIATPLRDAHGQVIGALVGVIDLSKPNFLDRITESRLGSPGGYLLIAPQHDLFVTATDKRRTMQPLPARGVNPMHDRYMLGYEGYGVATNSRGVEELSAAKGISAAGWFMVAVLPVEEAFAPIHAMQQGLLLAGTALTLLACCLIWWMLKRQLSPMLFTVKTLASLPDGSAPVQPLPIFRQDEIGELVGGFNRLLSSLMRHDEVLAKEKAFTETVLDEQLDSILVYESATGKAIRWNKTFRQMSGYTDEEIAGLTAPDAYLDRGDPARAAAAVASTPGAAPLQAERSLICKDGRKVVIECRESFIQGASGMQHYILCVGRDITGRKKIEAELELHRDHLEALVSFRTSELSEAKKAAEAASRAKSEFLAQMSHEIRTPMNAIVGAAQLIENEPLTRRQRDYAEIMRHSSQVLLSLINDILDISKIEAAQISLHAAPFDLGAMLDDTLRAASVLAAKKDLEIVLDLAADVPRLLVGDMKRLEQILTNLLSNAIKFTDHGSISLRVQQADARAGAVRLSFAVADTGIGIPPEQLDSIFDPFMQVDSGTTRRQGGIGLGLAISRQLAELMDGALEVRSVLGQGSEFSFTALFRLPSATESDAATALSAGRNPDIDERPPSASPLAGRRVLVIEDNHFNRIVLEGALQHLGIEVDLAIDGHDGVESFRIGQPYDAILVDLHMPGLDGFGCTRAIRALPEGRAVPILAVTANVLSTTAAQCCAAGMNAHLVKPVEPEILRHALMHWILGQRAAIQAKAPLPENGEADRLPDVLPGLDRARASGWSNGSASTLATLLDHALAHSGDDPEKLARYIAAGDVEAAAQITHDLMAVAATVGASALVALARQLNREIRAGSMNSMPANAAVESIGVAFAQLRATRELLRQPLAKG